MINVFSKYLFLPWENIVFHCIVVFLVLLFGVLLTISLYRLRRLTMFNYVKIKEYVIIVVISLVSFGVFYVHYALPIWLGCYMFMGVLEKQCRAIRYVCYVCQFDTTKASRNKMKMCVALTKPIELPVGEGLRVIAYVEKEKGRLASNILCDKLSQSFTWKKSFLSIKTYAVGLAIPAVSSILCGSQYPNDICTFFVILEGWITVLGVMFFLYPLAYFITVENEAHLLFDCSKTFKVIYWLIVLLLFTIITFISL